MHINIRNSLMFLVKIKIRLKRKLNRRRHTRAILNNTHSLMDYLISVGSHYLAIIPLTDYIMHRKHVFEMYIWLCEFPAWHMSLSYIILMMKLIYIIILTSAATLWIIRINLIYKTVTYETIKICSAINYRKGINVCVMWIWIRIMEIKESQGALICEQYDWA